MRRTRHKRNNEESSDVTINNFANSNSSSRRSKKNAMQVAINEIESLELSADEEDNIVVKKPHRRKKRTIEEQSDCSGVEYPIDIWYAIAEYLAPEDVGKFSAICFACYKVSKSARFWFSLYKRYYKPIDGMPEILQPSLMVRRYGLRALVIRSLYYTYQPFVAKSKRTLTVESNTLKGRVCTECWLEGVQSKTQWFYNFKLKEPTNNNYGRRETKPKPDLLNMLDNIDANVDDSCKILEVQSNRYCPFPMVIGQSLINFEMKMSSDYGFYNVQMQFSCGLNNYQASSVNIGNVVNARVLDWWHPSYKHSDQLHTGLFSSLLPEGCDFTTDDLY